MTFTEAKERKIIMKLAAIIAYAKNNIDKAAVGFTLVNAA